MHSDDPVVSTSDPQHTSAAQIHRRFQRAKQGTRSLNEAFLRDLPSLITAAATFRLPTALEEFNKFEGHVFDYFEQLTLNLKDAE